MAKSKNMLMMKQNMFSVNKVEMNIHATKNQDFRK